MVLSVQVALCTISHLFLLIIHGLGSVHFHMSEIIKLPLICMSYILFIQATIDIISASSLPDTLGVLT